MKNYNINSYGINNERGMAALLSVIVLSMIMVSTLSSFYIYIENRARFQERLRMNYQTGYVMEDMGRALAQGYDLAHETSPASCSAPTSLVYMDCTQVCAQDTTKLSGVVPAGTPQYAVCVKSGTLNKIINGADYFCAYNSGGGGQPSYCGSLADNNDLNSSSHGAVIVASANAPDPNLKIENWYARLDNFFDTTIVKKAPVLANKIYPILESKIQPPTLLGWLLPERAYAGSASGGGKSTICNSNPAFCKAPGAKVTMATIAGGCTASSTDSRCKKCSGDQRRGTDGNCLQVSICPPWLSSSACMAGNHDRRLHQMVRIN